MPGQHHRFKTHEYAGVTFALKNLGIGLPSQRVIGACKFGLPHRNVAEVHVDVNYIAQKLVPRQIHIVMPCMPEPGCPWLLTSSRA